MHSALSQPGALLSTAAVIAFTTPPSELPPAAALAAPVAWLHVATSGRYLGHSQGPVDLSPEVLAQLVRNFRADPKYQKGELDVGGQRLSGVGVQGVVQYDYEHASEMPPYEGSIPTTGAPAVGWVLDLELRPGPDGRTQLWALSKLGERIRQQLAADEYRSVSIAWSTETRHWVTGEPIGAVLTSIAFTNHPFLRDLERIAASRRAAAGAGSSATAVSPAGALDAAAVETISRTLDNHTNRRSDMTPELRTQLCSLFRLQPAADDAALLAAANRGTIVMSDLNAILTALGVSDPAAAQAVIPELMAARAKLQELMTELDGLMTADAAADEAMAEADVSAALAARNWRDAAIAPAVKAHRASLVQSELSKEAGKGVAAQRLARARGRAQFLATYGVSTDPRTAHLTRTLVAGPGPGGSVQQPLGGSPAQLPAAGGSTVDLSAFEGRNPTERIMSYLASQDPSFAGLPIETRLLRARNWRQAHLS